MSSESGTSEETAFPPADTAIISLAPERERAAPPVRRFKLPAIQLDDQAGRVLGGIATQPLVRRAAADPRGFGCARHRPAEFLHSADQQPSTGRARPCSTVEVHPGFLAVQLLMASNTTNFCQKDPG